MKNDLKLFIFQFFSNSTISWIYNIDLNDYFQCTENNVQYRHHMN